MIGLFDRPTQAHPGDLFIIVGPFPDKGRLTQRIDENQLPAFKPRPLPADQVISAPEGCNIPDPVVGSILHMVAEKLAPPPSGMPCAFLSMRTSPFMPVLSILP